MVMSEFHLRKIDLDLKEKRKSVNSFLKKVCETNFRLWWKRRILKFFSRVFFSLAGPFFEMSCNVATPQKKAVKEMCSVYGILETKFSDFLWLLHMSLITHKTKIFRFRIIKLNSTLIQFCCHHFLWIMNISFTKL